MCIAHGDLVVKNRYEPVTFEQIVKVQLLFLAIFYDFAANCTKLTLRELSLHLHELAMLAELLSNQNEVLWRKKRILIRKNTANTDTIAKWLRLASQLERVDLDPYKYEEAHFYCEPVGDMLDSNAKHQESIITPLTRFIFISSALEECYRFISRLYEDTYDLLVNVEYQRNYSAKAAYLLNYKEASIQKPKHYDHLVSNFLKIIQWYASVFSPNFDVELKDSGKLDFGLNLVRNIPNQIAHGVFPIIEDPEYAFQFNDPNVGLNMINLLGQASRLSAINIQMLLFVSSPGFESVSYEMSCQEEDYGEYFERNCNFAYLINLHIRQEFGLNEVDYFSYLSE